MNGSSSTERRRSSSDVRPRVAIVAPAFPPVLGGLEFHLGKLADGLTELGCTVEVLVQRRARDTSTPKISRLPSGVVVRRFLSVTSSRRFPVAPGLALFLLRHARKYDVIHGHSYHALPASMAALLTNRPFVYSGHYHGGGHTRAARVLHVAYRPIGKRTYSRADLIICQTRQEAAMVIEDFDRTEQHIRVIAPGVDVSSIRTAIPLEVDRPIVIAVGRLEEYKQHEIVIRAMPHLEERCRLVIIGSGPDETRLANLIDSLGLGEIVSMLGRIDEPMLRQWQRTAKVSVTLSRHEAYGLVLLEALASESVAVASRIAAHEEVAELAPKESVTFVSPNATSREVALAIDRALRVERPSEPLTLPSWDELTRQTYETYCDAVLQRSTKPAYKARRRALQTEPGADGR